MMPAACIDRAATWRASAAVFGSCGWFLSRNETWTHFGRGGNVVSDDPAASVRPGEETESPYGRVTSAISSPGRLRVSARQAGRFGV
jgi:hypothetical protein